MRENDKTIYFNKNNVKIPLVFQTKERGPIFSLIGVVYRTGNEVDNSHYYSFFYNWKQQSFYKLNDQKKDEITLSSFLQNENDGYVYLSIYNSQPYGTMVFLYVLLIFIIYTETKRSCNYSRAFLWFIETKHYN